MKIRWKRWALGVTVAVAAYAAAGFWLAPWALQRGVASYGHDPLQRQARIGKVEFNPFTLRLEARDLLLAEADGAPIASIARLGVWLSWKSITSRAWHFNAIELEAPVVNVRVAPDGAVNLARLAEDAARGRPASNDTSLPRLAIDRLAVSQGVIDLQDQRAGYANTLTPADFELSDFSTMPGSDDAHSFSARSRLGGAVRWRGNTSLNPLKATGELVVEGVPLHELSAYMQRQVRASIASGALSATIPYAVSYADGKLDARLKGASVTVQDLAIARAKSNEAFANLSQLAATGIDADLSRMEVSVGELRAQGGRLAVRRDARGALDLASLVRETPAPPADGAGAPQQANGSWKLALPRVVVERIALSAVDETLSPPLELRVGSVGTQLALEAKPGAGGVQVQVERGGLTLSDVSLARGTQPPVKLARAGVDEVSVDLAARRAVVGRLWAEGAGLDVVRDRAGNINLASWVPGNGSAAPPAARPAADAAWAYQLRSVQLSKLDARLTDESSGVKLRVVDAGATVEGASSELKNPLRFRAALSVQEGGQLAAEGTLVPATGAVQAKLRLGKLSLRPLQPLLAQHLRLKIGGGTFSAQGSLVRDAGGGARGRPALRYDGDFDLAGLVLNELDGGLFGSWQHLGTTRMSLALAPNRLEIPELRIAGADAKLIIEEDRSFNAARLLVQQPAQGAPAKGPSANVQAARLQPAKAQPQPQPPQAARTAQAQAPATAAAQAEEPFAVRIRRVRVQGGKLDFTDLSLRPQFSAKIQDLNGVVNGLSTSPSARAQVELDGRVDEFGLARIRGETGLAAPKDNTDLNVVFRNVDMVPASPYSMKFAGYRIAEGRISLDLQYKVRNSKIEGDNRIVIERLTLGERVESPDALKIPLQLAIAVLKDSNGRIDLGLPVSGDLSDPQFSYGAIIWKAITNVLTKIVTAPFRALGALVGGSGEKLEAITFDAGSGRLLPPELEKLSQVGRILGQREALRLTVPGQYNPAADGATLRALAVRREVAKRAGIQLREGEEAGPLDFGDRNIRSALRELYAQRFGDAELAKARQAAEKATAPAAGASAPASAAQASLPIWQRVGRVMSGEPQVADASGFYRQLRERLEREQPLPADALAQLGAQRAQAIVQALTRAGVDASRVTAGAPQALDEPAARTVPVKLELTAR